MAVLFHLLVGTGEAVTSFLEAKGDLADRMLAANVSPAQVLSPSWLLDRV